MNKKTLVTIAVIEAIVIVGLLGYIIANHNSFRAAGNFVQRGNGSFEAPIQFQINQSQQSAVTDFFDGAANQSQVNSYCRAQQNIPSCVYYCRNINPQNKYCSDLLSGRQAFYGGAQ